MTRGSKARKVLPFPWATRIATFVIWPRGSRSKETKGAKKRAETLLEYAADDWKYWSRFESVKGPHRAPFSPPPRSARSARALRIHAQFLSRRFVLVPRRDPLPVRTSHHNVSFFLVPGPVRVMGPLHGHLQPSFSSRDVIQGAHLPSPFLILRVAISTRSILIVVDFVTLWAWVYESMIEERYLIVSSDNWIRLLRLRMFWFRELKKRFMWFILMGLDQVISICSLWYWFKKQWRKNLWEINLNNCIIYELD